MAKQKSRYLYRKRTFLNPREGMAAIQASVRISEGDDYVNVDSGLTVSDCSRQINLDFEVWDSSRDKSYLRERRRKIALFREVVNAYLDATEKAYDELESKLEEKHKAKLKKEKERKAKESQKKAA